MLFQNHKGLIYLGISKNYQSVKGALVFSFGLPHISMRVSSPLQHLSLFLHPASVSSSTIFISLFFLNGLPCNTVITRSSRFLSHVWESLLTIKTKFLFLITGLRKLADNQDKVPVSYHRSEKACWQSRQSSCFLSQVWESLLTIKTKFLFLITGLRKLADNQDKVPVSYHRSEKACWQSRQSSCFLSQVWESLLTIKTKFLFLITGLRKLADNQDKVPVSYHMSEKACWQSRILVVPASRRLLHSTSLLFVRLPDLDSIIEDGLNITLQGSPSRVDGDAVIFWYSILFSGN